MSRRARFVFSIARARSVCAFERLDDFARRHGGESAFWADFEPRKIPWYTHRMMIAHLSDDELVTQLQGCCFDMRRMKARVLVILAEIEDRKIYLLSAASSMWNYARRLLLMSHSSAHRFIAVARLGRRYPWLIEKIERGEVHMTTLASIATFITDENVSELVEETAGKKRAEVDLVLVRRFGVDRRRTGDVMPYDEELLRLMDRARELLSHVIPSGDRLEIAKAAYTVLIAHLEKKTRAKADRPRPASRKNTKGISRHATRKMFERDGDQCTYVDERTGARCPSRAFLQRDHIRMRARGGGDEPENLRALCAPHNLLLAELALGRDYVEQRIRSRELKENG